MHALQLEQQALRDISEIQDLQPQLKLTALRKLAQYDEPMRRPTTLYDDYHAKVDELKQINSKMVATYTNALKASDISLVFPFLPTFAAPLAPAGDLRSPPTSSPSSGSAGSAPKLAPAVMNFDTALSPTATPTQLTPSAPHTDAANQLESDGIVGQPPGFCAEDGRGGLRLPEAALNYPEWMRTLLSDSLSDFCFQLKVLLPDGDATLLNQTLTQLDFLTRIREKVSVRTTWFLPFLYGLLGSAVFLMRNVANVRTAAIGGLSILMRASLGGVAGIVIGWFTATASPALQSTSSLSIPFALAFLTGYGIEGLFSLLDKLNQAIGQGTSSRA
jgi:hypothetical protein